MGRGAAQGGAGWAAEPGCELRPAFAPSRQPRPHRARCHRPGGAAFPAGSCEGPGGRTGKLFAGGSRRCHAEFSTLRAAACCGYALGGEAEQKGVP